MQQLRIMVVCGFGLGSSMVLKLKLDKVLQANNLPAITFCTDLMTATGEQYDIVFTSNELFPRFAQDERPVVAISNFLSEQEIAEKGVPIIQRVLADR